MTAPGRPPVLRSPLLDPFWFAAVFALAAGLVGLLGPAGLGAPRWHARPLAVFEPELLGVSWWRDLPTGSVHVETAFDANDAAGVSVELTPRDGGEAIVAVQWRRSGEEDWYLHAQPHNLGRTRLFFALAEDDNWSGEIAEITVSTLHSLPLEIVSLRIEARGPVAELRRAWFLFAGAETYRQSSLNWLGGMRIGGADWSWWLALIWLAYCGRWGAAYLLGHSAVPWRTISALALILWLAADLRFTANLFVAARTDLERFPRPLSAESAVAVVAASDPVYRQLVSVVEQMVPADAKLGFVSGDPSLLIRSKYVFYPRRVVHPPRRWLRERPDYVAVLYDQQIRYDPGRGVLSWGRFGRLPVEPLARLGDRVGLFRVVPRRPAVGSTDVGEDSGKGEGSG